MSKATFFPTYILPALFAQARLHPISGPQVLPTIFAFSPPAIFAFPPASYSHFKCMLAPLMSGGPENPGEPVKRKRGRPPKNNKLADSFPTLTLQFHTSPDSFSPTAELNSNLMVKMGEPDTFTPLMKVSPTIHKKRRRKSSVSTMLDDLPTKRRDIGDMLTPLSTTSHLSRQSFQVNAAAIENMSYITGSAPARPPPQAYHTPPHSSVKPGLGGGFDVARSEKIRIGHTENAGVFRHTENAGVFSQTENAGSFKHTDGNAGKFSHTDNVAGFRGELDRGIAAQRNLQAVDSDYPGRLSHLETDPRKLAEQKRQNTTLVGAPTLPLPEIAPAAKSFAVSPAKANHANLVSFVDDGNFSFELVVDDLGRAVLSSKPDTAKSSPSSFHLVEMDPIGVETAIPPKLTHAHTAIGIETVQTHMSHRRIPSDPSKALHAMSGGDSDPTDKFIVPQTPKGRDDFYVGYTPKYDMENSLAYNLTPQFNAMMYSMMSINSPQQKKGLLQPFMNMPVEAIGNTHYSRATPSLASSIDTELLGPGGRNGSNGVHEPVSTTSVVSSPGDEGDARAALKKVFRLKRDV